MKKKKKIALPDCVLLDCVGQDIKAKEFSFEHASNIFAIQAKEARQDWTLSEGQNDYQLQDGKLIKRTNSEDTSGGPTA